MSIVPVEPEQVQVRYVGYFKEPVFQVLGNPARLCQNLLKNFKPYGAEIRGLNIVLAVLSEAHVSCHLPSAGTARVFLDRFELFLQNAQDEAQVEGLVESGWLALADTDDSLATTTHELTVSTWARFRDNDFGSYIRRFVTSPTERWRPTVQFSYDDGGGSLSLEESNKASGGLWMQSVIRIDGVEPEVSEVMPLYRDRLKEQLHVAGLGLDLPV